MNQAMFHLCAAALALGSVAQGQDKPAQDRTKPMPGAADPKIQLFKIGDIHDLDLKNGDESIGEIDDLIVDSTDGRILFAVVGEGGVAGIGETEHLIPWESVRVTAKDMQTNEGAKATTKLTKQQLDAAPVYKKDNPIDAATARSARENARLAVDPRLDRLAFNKLVCTQRLNGTRVASTDDKDVGEIDDVVIAADQGYVAYTVVGVGGFLGMGEKHVALPWGVCEMTYKDPAKPKDLKVRMQVTKERLEKAPDYDKKDWKRVSTPAYVREISTYWSKDPFWARTTEASAPMPH